MGKTTKYIKLKTLILVLSYIINYDFTATKYKMITIKYHKNTFLWYFC